MPVRPIVATSDDTDEWRAKVMKAEGTKLTVKISIPSDCLIGRYKMGVRTRVGGDFAFRLAFEEHIYVLFNPWCEGKLVR